MKMLSLSSVNPYPPTDGGEIGVFLLNQVFKKRGIELCKKNKKPILGG